MMLCVQGKIKSLESIYLFSMPVKEYQIVEYFLGSALKDEVMKIMPVQKQTRAGQRTRFKVQQQPCSLCSSVDRQITWMQRRCFLVLLPVAVMVWERSLEHAPSVEAEMTWGRPACIWMEDVFCSMSAAVCVLPVAACRPLWLWVTATATWVSVSSAPRR